MENIPNNENLTEEVVLDDTLTKTVENDNIENTNQENETAKAELMDKILSAKEETVEEVVEPAATEANIKPVEEVAIDISDIPMDESASVSSVLGNLDDEPVIEQTVLEEPATNDVDFDVDFNEEEIDFSKEAEKDDISVEDALNEDVVKQSKDEEKYIYKSYADQKISTRGNDPKLNFLDKISVDLKEVTVVKKPAIQQVDDINTLFNTNVATFTVTCCQSGYWASMSGLTLAEKNAINNSDGGSIFQFRQKLYKTVYNKIQAMSIPKPTFNNWLKITSFSDLSTLLFGIYCQTFIDNNDFDITCGKCGNTTSATVNNQSLVEVRDRSVFEKRDEIISTIENGEQLVAKSIVHKDERIILDESKIIVDVATPSLHDHLTLLQSSKQETLQDYADTFSAMLFISHLYMLDIKETYNTGHAVYYEVTDKARILSILLKLSNNDGEQLENAIQDKLGKYQINYEIHNVTCSHCKTKLPGIPVDIETILFTRLNRTNTEK